VLNNEGTDQWRLRRLLTPAFSRRLIDALKPRFLAVAAELAVAVAAGNR
jgi:cytochrome P450